jgi:8-oxo-dGTP diphosphatase/putative hydrolase of the HAD superfamily
MFEKDQVRWIFFDIGETLVDESKPIRDVMEQFINAAKQLGYGFRLEEVKRSMLHFHSQLCAHPMRDVIEKLIPSAADRAEIRLNMKYKKDLEQPFVEAEGVLKQLFGSYQLGVIANQNAGTEERLERYGLLKYFSLVCSSEEEGLTKPDLLFFELALERAKCEARNAVMIGDRLDNDIMPAKRLGMQAIWIRQGFAREQSVANPLLAPDVIIDELHELVNIFD